VFTGCSLLFTAISWHVSVSVIFAMFLPVNNQKLKDRMEFTFQVVRWLANIGQYWPLFGN